MRIRFEFLILLSEVVAQDCKNSSDCPSSSKGICGKDSKCIACTDNSDCRGAMGRDNTKADKPQPTNLGLYFCKEGKCQGILGDDDITGYGNNPKNAILGTSNDVAIRNCKDANPLGPNDKPSVRKVSNEAHVREEGDAGKHSQQCPNNRVANSLAVFFGQLVDHDITLFGEVHATTDGLKLEADSLSRIFLENNRLDENSGTPTMEITSYIDGSSVYGSHPERLDTLRAKPADVCSTLELDVCEPDCAKSEDGTKCVAKPTCDATKKCDETLCYLDGDTCTPIPGLNGVNGLLRWNNKKDDGKREMLPVPDAEAEIKCLNDFNQLLHAGDGRAGENTVLALLHTIFFREHNRIAREYKKDNKTKNDREVFQFARGILRRTFQKIIYEEWLPTLLGEKAVQPGRYDASKSPQISMEFAVSAFRWGHSALPEEIEINGKKSVKLAETLSNSKLLFDNFDDVLKGALEQEMEKVDGATSDQLRNILFSSLKASRGEECSLTPAGSNDLITRNILRGRMLGIPTLREFYECPAYKSYFKKEEIDKVKNEGIDTTDEIKGRLNKAYNNDLSRMDLFTGMLNERSFDSGKHDSGGFSKALQAAHVEQFKRLAESDRFFYKNMKKLSRDDAKYQSKDFADVIQKNTGLKINSDDVFSIVKSTKRALKDDTII